MDGCVGLVAGRAKALGGRVKLHRQREFGDVLEVRFGPRSRIGAAGGVLLLGHLDTVWPVGTLKTMPCRLKRRTVVGSGDAGHEGGRGDGPDGAGDADGGGLAW